MSQDHTPKNRQDYGENSPQAAEERMRDPGLGTISGSVNQRLVNKDGSFNIRRMGSFRYLLHPYQFMILLPWWKFGLVVLFTYVLLNSLFAGLYLLAGVGSLSGAPEGGLLLQFAHAFFFSAQTITTVGYGTISPAGMVVNMIATFEAMIGLLGFAMASGLMYGRFSRASARVAFSENLLVAPYGEINGLMFRIGNHRKNQLIELKASVVLMTYEQEERGIVRHFYPLELERAEVALFPLTWTLVHPLDENSPLLKFGRQSLVDVQAEIMVNLKGFDDTFSQVVHLRHSYLAHELVWGGKFEPAFYVEEDGMVVLDLDEVSTFQSVAMNPFPEKSALRKEIEQGANSQAAQTNASTDS
jgi:inward rectifier potassium channel